MNKYFICLISLVLLFVSVAYSTDTRARTITAREGPAGIKVYDLHTPYTAESIDTFAASNDNNFYGPYELCSEGEQMPTKFAVEFDAATGTTPTLGFDYMLISSFDMGDTITGMWITGDTLDGTPSRKEITFSSQTIGKAIVFQVNNYDGTASQLPGLLRVMIPAATTVTKMKR